MTRHALVASIAALAIIAGLWAMALTHRDRAEWDDYQDALRGRL